MRNKYPRAAAKIKNKNDYTRKKFVDEIRLLRIAY